MRQIDADRLKETIKELDAESPDIKTARIVNRVIQEIFPQIVDDEPTIEAEPDKDWISVKDRLPEPGIPVLALQLDVPHQRTRYWLVRLIVYDTIDPLTGKKTMSWFPNYGGYCVENIAYWHPIA